MNFLVDLLAVWSVGQLFGGLVGQPVGWTVCGLDV